MTVGAIDIGSNSVRLLTIDDGGNEIRREVAVTALAAGVDRSRRISEAAATRTLEVLVRFGEWLEADGVTVVAAVATAACRDAVNGDEVLGSFESILGVRPQIISGDREAELAFAGATLGRDAGASTTVIDIGGGSTEIISGDDRLRWSYSYDIGSVRLTERTIPTRPAPAAEVEAARSEATSIFSDPAPPSASGVVIGVAGTFTSLAAMALGLDRYERDRVDGTVLTTTDLDRLAGDLERRTLEATAAIPSLDPKRAPVILAGAVVARASLEAVAADEVTVSETDLLDGLAEAVRSGSAL